MAERHVAGDRLSAFLDDELGDDVALAVAHHLAACDRCLLELEGLRATRDALRRLPSLQAPLLVRSEPSRSSHHRAAWRRVRTAAAVVALPVLAGVAIYVAGGDPGRVEPTTELFLVEHVGRTGGGPVPSPIGGDER